MRGIAPPCQGEGARQLPYAGFDFYEAHRMPLRPSLIALLALAFAASAALAAASQPAPKPSGLKPQPIDINSADLVELQTLPGIGKAEAVRIVAARPYRSKTRLLEANVLNEAQFDAVNRHVVANQKSLPKPAKPTQAKP